MENDDTSELVILCEEILEDGEVSVEEIRRLGKWLEDNQACRYTWPADVLTQPLQEVLLDDKVNKIELRKVSTLLRGIQKEWAIRQNQQAQQDAVAKATAIAKAFDLSCAHLPSIPITLSIASHSERGVVYSVDLTGPSCNCPDWKSNRSTLAIGDPTRCCKHVFDAFSRVRPPSGWPGWLEAFFEEGWRVHPSVRWRVLDVFGLLVLASTAPVDWANVFAPWGNVGYQRFGYSVPQRRWAYNKEPLNADSIAKAIRSGLLDAYGSSSQDKSGKGGGSFFSRIFRS